MCRYLQEVGYTDTILDVKSKRVRALLGFSSDVTDREDDKNQESAINGTEAEVKETAMIGWVFKLEIVLAITSVFIE